MRRNISALITIIFLHASVLNAGYASLTITPTQSSLHIKQAYVVNVLGIAYTHCADFRDAPEQAVVFLFAEPEQTTQDTVTDIARATQMLFSVQQISRIIQHVFAHIDIPIDTSIHGAVPHITWGTTHKVHREEQRLSEAMFLGGKEIQKKISYKIMQRQHRASVQNIRDYTRCMHTRHGEMRCRIQKRWYIKIPAYEDPAAETQSMMRFI